MRQQALFITVNEAEFDDEHFDGGERALAASDDLCLGCLNIQLDRTWPLEPSSVDLGIQGGDWELDEVSIAVSFRAVTSASALLEKEAGLQLIRCAEDGAPQLHMPTHAKGLQPFRTLRLRLNHQYRRIWKDVPKLYCPVAYI